MKSGKAKTIQSDFIQLNSIDDLARLASSFDSSMSSIYAVKEGKALRLMFPEEKLEDSVNVYYFNLPAVKSYMVYDPSGLRPAATEMKDSLRDELQNYKANKIEVVRMKENPFTQAKKPTKVKSIELEDYASIIRGVANLSAHKEEMGKVYIFENAGSSFMGTFEMLHKKGVEIFTYAKIKKGIRPAFFRYDYSTEAIEPADAISDNTSHFICAINLAKPFSFFKG